MVKPKSNSGKTLGMVFLLLGLCLGLIGCSSNANKAPTQILLKDHLGRTVELPGIPQRIVSLAPGNTEILFALGLEERIVGVTNYCDYPRAAKTKAQVGEYANPNLEMLLALQPDFVLADSLHLPLGDALDRAGVPVLFLNPLSLDETMESLRLVGQATGVESTAETLISQLQQEVQQIESQVQRISAGEKPLVYYEIWDEPILTAGPGTIINDLIIRAGGRNLAEDATTAYPEYSLEMLIQKNPQVMIQGNAHDPESSSTTAEIQNRKGWAHLACIQGNRIYLVNADLVSRPGPRLVEGLALFAQAIHPELNSQPD